MERVIAVGVQLSSDKSVNAEASMQELLQLVETAGGEVVETHFQNRHQPDPATYIGKGKTQEIAERIRNSHIQALIVDNELKPGQQRNLEEIMGVKVIDRTRLILDIFAARARTREGQLQVELAQLEYRLPRLGGHGSMMDSQSGGIGTRGPGERKLEVDRRRVRDRITKLNRQIEKIKEERTLQRSVRREIPVPQVALVGYTNAGKSTLLNRLMSLAATSQQADKAVYADDKLFATLDPTTRRIRLPNGRVILMTDTVGFIRNLPTQLVAAFRATLEELHSSDLLLHVIDRSDPDWKSHEETVLGIIKDLKADQLPMVTVYNKIDRLDLAHDHESNETSHPGLWISASVGKGIPELLERIERILREQWVEDDLFLTFEQGALWGQLHHLMEIVHQEVGPDGIHVRVRSHPSTLAQFATKLRDPRK